MVQLVGRKRTEWLVVDSDSERAAGYCRSKLNLGLLSCTEISSLQLDAELNRRPSQLKARHARPGTDLGHARHKRMKIELHMYV